MLLMGKSTISVVIFNSYVSLPEGTVDGCEKYRNPASPWMVESCFLSLCNKLPEGFVYFVSAVDRSLVES